VLLILASRTDDAARALIERWAGAAVLLTPGDLSQSGWALGVGVGGGRAVIAGVSTPVDRITGVLTRLPWVLPHELPHVVEEDRDYVAAEMSAFLLAWLHGLACPVLNPASPECLMGPSGWPGWWLRAAAEAGLRVRSERHRVTRPATTPPDEPSTSVAVVGREAFGAADPSVLDAARRLAAATDVALLRVHFSGPSTGAAVLGADLWPDLLAPGVPEAILALFEAKKP
jgi:hypothetical protein